MYIDRYILSMQSWYFLYIEFLNDLSEILTHDNRYSVVFIYVMKQLRTEKTRPNTHWIEMRYLDLQFLTFSTDTNV